MNWKIVSSQSACAINVIRLLSQSIDDKLLCLKEMFEIFFVENHNYGNLGGGHEI